MSTSEQDDYRGRNLEIVRQYPFVLWEEINENGHSTQDVNVGRFSKPEGILSSHGSGLSDVQPPSPFWDYATYHARRSPYPDPRSFTNYSGYVFRDGDPYPLPCPFIPEESLKPQSYGFDTHYAYLMGKSASMVAGGTFHHDAWNEPRIFTDQEFDCAESFYAGVDNL
jgi:hypothetical protein